MKPELKYGHQTIEALKLHKRSKSRDWLLRVIAAIGFGVLVLGCVYAFGGML